ncbi:MAG: hypothetical protein J6V93_02675 [Clostridia bacterium]|nr:hypothetical protein [Clostridia bacterium]
MLVEDASTRSVIFTAESTEVAANLKSDEYFANYFNESISLIIIKPYKAVGI